MSEENTNPTMQYNFNMGKLEKQFTVVIALVFLVSVLDMTNLFWTIFFYSFAAVIFIYYFVWYRKKSVYVLIDDQRIIIHSPPFFKPIELERQQIEQIVTADKSIKINYKVQGTSKSIVIYSIMLGNDDWKQLTAALGQP